jgi:hypothetical protein
MLVTDAVATTLTKLGAPRHAETTLRGHSRTLAHGVVALPATRRRNANRDDNHHEEEKDVGSEEDDGKPPDAGDISLLLR